METVAVMWKIAISIFIGSCIGLLWMWLTVTIGDWLNGKGYKMISSVLASTIIVSGVVSLLSIWCIWWILALCTSCSVGFIIYWSACMCNKKKFLDE